MYKKIFLKTKKAKINKKTKYYVYIFGFPIYLKNKFMMYVLGMFFLISRQFLGNFDYYFYSISIKNRFTFIFQDAFEVHFSCLLKKTSQIFLCRFNCLVSVPLFF
jgi:hypothetical protein